MKKAVLGRPMYEALKAALKEASKRNDAENPMSIESFFERMEKLTLKKLGARARRLLLGKLRERDYLVEYKEGKAWRQSRL